MSIRAKYKGFLFIMITFFSKQPVKELFLRVFIKLQYFPGNEHPRNKKTLAFVNISVPGLTMLSGIPIYKLFLCAETQRGPLKRKQMKYTANIYSDQTFAFCFCNQYKIRGKNLNAKYHDNWGAITVEDTTKGSYTELTLKVLMAVA